MDIDMDMDSECGKRNTGYGTRDTEHGIRNTGYGMPKRNTETECRNGIQGPFCVSKMEKSVISR